MAALGFHRAERKRVWLKLAITGPSGSGKTYSALKMGFGLGQRIAFLDTENGSGELYAHLGDYSVVQVGPPFTVQKYIDVIDLAVSEGFDVLIVDSLSHAWASDGGLLAQKEALDKHSSNANRFGNWGEITKQYERFKSKLLQSPIHLIACMRSKVEYVQEKNEKGDTTVRKVGLAPVMRDGIEYEFTTLFDLGMDHGAVASKDRTGLWDGHTQPISEETGRRFAQWLESGAEPLMNVANLTALAIRKGFNEDKLNTVAAKSYGRLVAECTEAELIQMAEKLNSYPDAASESAPADSAAADVPNTPAESANNQED